MRSQSVIVEIMPSLVAVRVVRAGNVAAWRESLCERNDWGEDWTKHDADVRGRLGKIVEELGVRGSRATVVYDAPTSAVVVQAMASGVPAPKVLESARLACEAAMGEGGERSEGAAATMGVSGATHVVACMDRAETLSRLAAIVESSGLRVGAMVPRDACALMGTTRGVREEQAGARVVAWIGRHSMALAVALDGTLIAARSVGLGLDSLVEAMTRASRGGATLYRSRAEAWPALWDQGVPSPDEAEGENAKALSTLLPVMQPVLQRMAVELKQFLRFEIEAGAREAACVQVVGPGARCAGLRAALCRITGLQPSAERTPAEDARWGESGEAVRAGGGLPELLPERHARRSVLRRVRVSAAVGAAVALAMGVQARREAIRDASQARTEEQALRARVEQARSAAEAERSAIAAWSEVAGARARLHKSIGEAPSVAGLLGAMGQGLSPSVRVTSIELSAGGAAPGQVVVTALAPIEGEAGSAQAVREFVTALARMPLMREVKLGAAQRVTVQGRDYQSFTVTAGLVGVPAGERTAMGGAE